MNPPGTDISDPKVLAGARRVATRRNNDARRKLEAERARLPLLADQLPSVKELPVITAEDVIERRKIGQQGAWESGVERDVAEIERIRGYRNDVFSMVGEDEYSQFYAASLEWRFPQWAYWYNVREQIKRRSEPMPPDAELVLTWLVDWEGQPPTIGELHATRGDGMTWRQISEALAWLERRFYVEGHQIRPCRFAEERLKDIGVAGLSSPFSATEAGVNLLIS
jgi:hypothetical protein